MIPRKQVEVIGKSKEHAMEVAMKTSRTHVHTYTYLAQDIYKKHRVSVTTRLDAINADWEPFVD